MEKIIFEKQKAQDLLRNKMDLKIYFKNKERLVQASRVFTVSELFSRIYDEFSLSTEPEFATDNLNSDEDKDDESSVEEGEKDEEEDNNNNGIDDSADVNNGIIIDDIDLDIDDDNKKMKVNMKVKRKRKEVTISENIQNIQKNQNIHKVNFDTSLPSNKIIEKNIENSTDKNSENVNFENMRLRFYNITTRISTDVFDYNSKNKSLESLGFCSYRYLILEIKNKNDNFEIYHMDGFNVSLEGYNNENNIFEDVRTVRVPKNGTLNDLKNIVRPWIEYSKDDIR